MKFYDWFLSYFGVHYEESLNPSIARDIREAWIKGYGEGYLACEYDNKDRGVESCLP